MRASSLDANGRRQCKSSPTFTHLPLLNACRLQIGRAGSISLCILDVNRQSRTASETTARNVRSQLGQDERLVFGMKPRSTAFHA